MDNSSKWIANPADSTETCDKRCHAKDSGEVLFFKKTQRLAGSGEAVLGGAGAISYYQVGPIKEIKSFYSIFVNK